MIECLSELMTKKLTLWLIEWLVFIEWLFECSILKWIEDLLDSWLIDLWVEWLICKSNVWFANCLIYSLMQWLINRLGHLLINWFTNWVDDLLIDGWFIN